MNYNNVLMERRGGRRIAYMPVYRYHRIDRAAAKVYESLGFEVRPVDASGIYRGGGALRCVVNVTARHADVSDLPTRMPQQPGHHGKAGRLRRAAVRHGPSVNGDKDKLRSWQASWPGDSSSMHAAEAGAVVRQ
jgi:hypothetical protein